jgi:hypothetical protein
MSNISTNLNWSDPIAIKRGEYLSLPNYAGIYMIFCNAYRVLLVRPAELLYIGEAQDIRDRFGTKSKDEWDCLEKVCSHGFYIKTASCDLSDSDRQKVECLLINQYAGDLGSCQTECVGDWPHAEDTVRVQNGGNRTPLSMMYSL